MSWGKQFLIVAMLVGLAAGTFLRVGGLAVHAEGNTWTVANKYRGVVAFTTVAFNPRNPDIIYAAGHHIIPIFGEMQKSTDGGTTWDSITVSALSGPILSITLSPSDPKVLYVGALFGVWKSIY